MGTCKVGQMTLGSVATNCYYLQNTESNKVIFVDPAEDGAYIYSVLQKKGLIIDGILLTHAHFDHILGAEELRNLSGAKIYAYEKEAPFCTDAKANLSMIVGTPCQIKPDVYLKDEEEFELAGIKGKLLATPGHTPGSCCYYFEEEKILLSGDTLFMESVGRTDFPKGSMKALTNSLREKLYHLPEETRVYPGHGEATTIGYEKQYNSYFRA